MALENRQIRRIEFDILKGILIVFVVIGHSQISTELHRIIYWFHMPAFFLVNGYLSNNYTLNWDNIITKFKRLIIPYLSFSVVLYIIFQPEPIWKNFLRVILGGSINTTSYSYPTSLSICIAVILPVILHLAIKRSKWLSTLFLGV